MAWIESHQSLRDHPKTRKSARALDISVPAMIGHLHCLWHQALDLALDGDLTRWDHDDIAHAAMWDGNPQQFVDALVGCGFADGPGFLDRTDDGRLIIHDWEDYTAGLRKRQQASAQANHQRWHVDKGVVQADCDLCPDTIPSDSGSDTTSDRSDSERSPKGDPDGSERTPPDLTGPDRTSPSTASATQAEPGVLDALYAEFYPDDPLPANSDTFTRMLDAARIIERHGGTYEQVPVRAKEWRKDHDYRLNPTVLARWWADLTPERPSRSRADPDETSAINNAAGHAAAGDYDTAAEVLAAVGLDLDALDAA